MLSLILIGCLFLHTATSQEVLVTCMCGLFIEEQFSGGGGQSRPVPLEYIGTGTDITDPDGTICDSTVVLPCDDLCRDVAEAWSENVTTCGAYPNDYAHCYNSRYCDGLKNDPRLPKTLSCEQLQVRSLIKQCPPESERGDWWSDTLSIIVSMELSCDEYEHVCDPDCPCRCDCDSPPLCRPQGCTLF